MSGVFGGISAVDSPILMIFLLILMGYAVKGVFANLKREASFSSDFCWKPLSVQCPAGIYRWIYQLVQAGGRAVPDSFFAGSDPDGRADGSKGPCAVGDGADVIGRKSPGSQGSLGWIQQRGLM